MISEWTLGSLPRCSLRDGESYFGRRFHSSGRDVYGRWAGGAKTSAMNTSTYLIVYDLRCSDGLEKQFRVRLNPLTFSIIPFEAESAPTWTALTYEQCECCTLDAATTATCPIAVNISEIVEEFKDRTSTEECKVRCRTPERVYLKKTNLMEAITSIFGIIMATSGCPVLDVFRPMARFHLPFSTGEETPFGAVSMFLLRDYFNNDQGTSPAEAMTSLENHYARVKQVNEGLYARITSISSEDADKNAIVMLHSLSQLLCMEANCNLNSLAYLFKPNRP